MINFLKKMNHNLASHALKNAEEKHALHEIAIYGLLGNRSKHTRSY